MTPDEERPVDWENLTEAQKARVSEWMDQMRQFADLALSDPEMVARVLRSTR